ncbi:TPM domain-containing protein [Sorangium cellulosum]|nr:TPM domain-containing protein [Sorangium cellulosum]
MMFFALSRALAAPAVTIQAAVTDLAGALAREERDDLARKLVAHRERTGVQIAVLLVRTTGGVPIEDYSLEIAEAWGGGTKGQDNGVLYTLAIDDRRMRIEVGYGLEDILTDGVCRTILDASRDDLRRAQYGGAAHLVVDRLIALTAGQRAMPGWMPAGLVSPSRHLTARYIAHYGLGALIGFLLGSTIWRARRPPATTGEPERQATPGRGKPRVAIKVVFAFIVVPALAVLAPAWVYGARSEAAASMYLSQQAGCLFGVMLLSTLLGLLGGLSFFHGRAQAELQTPWKAFLRTLGVALGLVLPLCSGLVELAAARASLSFLTFFASFVTSFVTSQLFLLGYSSANGSGASSGSSWSSSSGSSSFSSSSSSSCSSSSSSSSSSSDYGGGGGSFGGGGASSSW